MFRFGVFAALSLLVVACVARADDAATGSSAFRDRYPPSSIDSVPKADAALTAAKAERARVEREYRTTARGCMSRFLVNDCLNAARDAQRRRLGEVDAVEVDANRYKRRERADRSDADLAKREAERAANEKADTAQRAKNRNTYEARQADAARDAARAESRTPPGPKKPPAAKETEASAAQRAKNAVAYTDKVDDATRHRADLERRRAEKVAERKRRAAEKAAKAAAQAVKPPAT